MYVWVERAKSLESVGVSLQGREREATFSEVT